MWLRKKDVLLIVCDNIRRKTYVMTASQFMRRYMDYEHVGSKEERRKAVER